MEGVNVSLGVKGLPTGGWVRVLQSPSDVNGETSYSYYDNKGRNLRTKTTNYLGGYLIKDTSIDFDGTAQYTITKFKRLNTGVELTLRDNYTYTAQDRLKSHIHKINNLTAQILADNEYDEMGQLKLKRVGGTGAIGTTLQKIDYKYNIRGWLTDINNVDNLSESGTLPDLFAHKVNYNLLGDNLDGRISPLYNGNISETLWRSSKDNILRKYSYKYDKINRLTDAYYQKPGQSIPESGSYNESVSYDNNGNITSLSRTGGVDDYNTVVDIDALLYTYYPNSNQLQLLVDDSESPEGFYDMANGVGGIDYTYDAKGNMRTDVNKNITSIIYNHLNLPTEIVFNNSATQKINYLYNAAGVKVKKVVTDGTKIVTVDYLNGFQYKNSVLQFFPTAEGYVDYLPPSGTSLLPTYNYIYQYKDHLGNVRMNYTYSPSFKSWPGGVVIKDESHYYPFGLKHINYNMDYLEYQEIEGDIVLYPPLSTTGKLAYNYKFQGQERQDELGLNWDSFKWRNYDYAIGRFMNIDPLTEQYNTWSPYAFSGNRVIDSRELEGLEPHSVHKTYKAAAENFGKEYNGLSIRMNGEIATQFYKTTVNGETSYSYTRPYSGGPDSGMVNPRNAEAVPKEGSYVGYGHTHGADRNKQVRVDGIIYADNDNKPSDVDVDKSNDINSSTYEKDVVITPNGSLFFHDGKTNEDTVKPTSTNMPSDPRSRTRTNTVSPNHSPEVLPSGGIDRDNFPAIPNNTKPKKL